MPSRNDLGFKNSETDNEPEPGEVIKLCKRINSENNNTEEAILENNSKGTECSSDIEEQNSDQNLLIKGLSLLNLVDLVEFDKRDSNIIKQLWDEGEVTSSNISMLSSVDNNALRHFRNDNKEVSVEVTGTMPTTKDFCKAHSNNLSNYQVLYLETIYDEDSEEEIQVTDVESCYCHKEVPTCLCPNYKNSRQELNEPQYSSYENICINYNQYDNVNYCRLDPNTPCECYENSTTLSEESEEVESDHLTSDGTEKCEVKPDEEMCTLRDFCQQFKLLYVPKRGKPSKPMNGVSVNNAEKKCNNSQYCKRFGGSFGYQLKSFKHKLKFPPIPEQPSTVSCQLSPILCTALSSQSVRKRESVFSKFIRRCRGHKHKKTRTINRKCACKKVNNVCDCLKSQNTTTYKPTVSAPDGDSRRQVSPGVIEEFKNTNLHQVFKNSNVDEQTHYAAPSQCVYTGMDTKPSARHTTNVVGCAHASTSMSKAMCKDFTHSPFIQLTDPKYSNSLSTISVECEVPIGSTIQTMLTQPKNSSLNARRKKPRITETPLCIKDAIKAPKKCQYHTNKKCTYTNRLKQESKGKFENTRDAIEDKPNLTKISSDGQCKCNMVKKNYTHDKGITCLLIGDSKLLISKKVSCTQPAVKKCSAQNSCLILLPPKIKSTKESKVNSCCKCTNPTKTITHDKGISCKQVQEKKHTVSKGVDGLPVNIKYSVQVSCSSLELKSNKSESSKVCKCKLTKKPSTYDKCVSCHALEEKKKSVLQKISCTDTLSKRNSAQTLYSTILAAIKGKEPTCSKHKGMCKSKIPAKDDKGVSCQSIEQKKILISQKISCTQPPVQKFSVQISCTNLLEPVEPKKSACVGTDQSTETKKSNKSCGQTIICDLINAGQNVKKRSVQISCSSLLPSLTPKDCTCVGTNTSSIEPIKTSKQCVQTLTTNVLPISSGNTKYPEYYDSLYNKKDTSPTKTANGANCKDCSELSNSINKFFQLLGSILGKEDGQSEEFPQMHSIKNQNYNKKFEKLTATPSRTSEVCSNEDLLDKFHSKLINNLINELYAKSDNDYEKLDCRIKNLDRALQSTIIEPYLLYLKNQNEEEEMEIKKHQDVHNQKKEKKHKEESPRTRFHSNICQKQPRLQRRNKLCLCQIQSMEVSNGLRKRNIINVCDISKMNNKKVKENNLCKETDQNYYYNSFLPTKVDDTKKSSINYCECVQKPTKSKRSRKNKIVEPVDQIEVSVRSSESYLSNNLLPSSFCNLCKEEREIACTSTLDAPSLFCHKYSENTKLPCKTHCKGVLKEK